MPSAVSIIVSQDFEGNDGSWSTFVLEIGSKQQSFHVLPATSQSSTWVPLTGGCNGASPANCSNLRGGLLDLSNPSADPSFQPESPPGGNGPYYYLPFDSESSLNYSTTGEVGFDTLTLGVNGASSSIQLQNQLVAGYDDPFPWLGIFGLNAIPSHIFNATSSQNSPLQSLKSNGDIPSLYFGYTAGAFYTTPPTFGSLTLGGYDAARVDMSSALTLPMSATSIDLSVWLNHIKINGQLVSGLGNGIFALIDSLVPEIWLPLEACQSFEQQLGLVWNSTAEMYLINSTQHSNLLSQNSSITFFLGSQSGATNSTPITLPYAAFDLTARFPLANITSGTESLRYFPLQRASGDNYYLGRTFLQEAYLAVDYEKQQLSLGQALFPSSQTAMNLVTVDHSSSSSTSLSGGAIAGIVIGALAGVALIGGLLFWLWWRRRQYFIHKDRSESERRQRGPSSVGDTTLMAETEMDEHERRREDRINEWFKPGPIFPPPETEAFMKPELDATQTATGFRVTQTGVEQRHELDDGVARPSPHRSQVSWGSQGSVVSPLPHEERVRSLQMSETSHGGPASDASSPPMLASHGRNFSSDSSPGLYEMQ